MTKFFKSKKKAAEIKPAEPRQEADIRKEYADVSLAAGQVQYQLYVYKSELARLNAKLLELNQEGAARQQLDKAAADAAKIAQIEEAQS